MKLRFSPTSPYVRKVMVAAQETGLDADIELIATNPWDPATDLAQDNPLGKVPALLTEGNEVLYDSPVILEYLDSLNKGVELIPKDGEPRWTALRRQALADGILDAAVSRLLESRRPDGERSEGWMKRQKAAVDRTLDAMEAEADGFGDTVDVGTITIGVALGYLDFRFPGDDWRAPHPALADWYDGFSTRPSMMETEPREPTS